MEKQKVTSIERGPGRPEGGYDFKNRHYPGTTTITNRFKDSKGLMRWQWHQGFEEGVQRERAAWRGRVRRIFGYNARRDKAATLGGHVHDAIEKDIHGENGEAHINGLYLPELDHSRCRRAFDAYISWRDSVDLELLATEIPMRSETYRFGGTLDAVARINGKVCLLDWKTSNGVYPDYLVQLGGYAVLWMETRGEAFEGAHLLRFSKEDGSFEHHEWDRKTLGLGAEQFLLFRKAYDLDYQLKKAMKR